jgi:hypothetical protein
MESLKMKLFEKLMVIWVLALITFFVWQHRGQSPTRQTEVAVSTAAPVAPVAPVPTVMAAPVPVVFQTYSPPKPVDPFHQTMDLLRLKLKQWRESRLLDPDCKSCQDQLMNEMLALVTDANVAQIMQALSPQEMNTPFGTGVLGHWMQADPAAATAWMASSPDATPTLTLAVADYWSTNTDGLQQLVGSLPDTAWKQNLLQQTSEEISRNDPADAAKLAQQMQPGDALTNAMQAVACNWASTDPNAALDWINSVTDPAMRDRLIASAAQSYALTDPALAATWLVTSDNSDQIVNDAALNILRTWVTKDPAQAADWVSQFPGGSVQASGIQIVSQYWSQKDPDAAAAWIQNLSGAQPAPVN